MKATVQVYGEMIYNWWKPQDWLKAPLSLHRNLYAMTMSTDMSKVDVALFPTSQPIFLYKKSKWFIKIIFLRKLSKKSMEL